MTQTPTDHNQALRDALHAMLWRHKASMTNWTQARADAQRDGELDLASSIANTAIAALSGFPIENAIAALAMQEPAPASACDHRWGGGNDGEYCIKCGTEKSAPASAPSCCGWEEAAKIIEQNQITNTNQGDGTPYLSPRKHGSTEGLAYAAAIRARAQPCRCGEVREALEVAANRLDLLSLDWPTDSRRYYEVKEWGEQARAAAAPRSGESK
jgi:hypothetical protein